VASLPKSDDDSAIDRARALIARWVNLPALTAVMIWSGVYPFSKYALRDFPVIAFIAFRPLIAVVLIFALLKARGEPLAIARSDRPRIIAAGLLGMFTFQVAFVAGLERTSASHSVLLTTTSPLIGAAILWGIGRYRPDRRSLIGLVLGFAGVALLVQGSGGEGGATLIGDLLTLVAAAAWVGTTIIPGPLVGRYGPVRVTAWLILCSAVAMLPILPSSLAAIQRDMPSLWAWLALLYSTILGMILANALWQRAVHKLGSTQTLAYAYIQPFVTILLAAMLLGERLGLIQAVGGLVALVGVGLVRQK
jgi:drug/metabolite transporter (DMT)-like permease